MGQTEQGKQNRTAEQNSRIGQQNRTRTVRIGLLGQDSQSRTAGAGQPGQDSQSRTARAGQPEKDSQGCQDRTPIQDRQERTFRT
jgi:hypothetical protein